MAECVCLPKCIFFNDRMSEMPLTAETMKQNYCLESFDQCARYMVFDKLGRERVPSDLYPNQHPKAIELLTEG